MIKLTLEVICKDYKHKRIIENKIITNEKSEEYYIIPITHEYHTDFDDEIYKLTFNNQLLWLKYSNHNKEIIIKEYDFLDFIIIKSTDILDIKTHILTDNHTIKNVWSPSLQIRFSKYEIDEYYLVLPIFEEDLINIEWTEQYTYDITLLTNEILLKQVKVKGKDSGRITLNNNISMNKTGLFIKINRYDVSTFIK